MTSLIQHPDRVRIASAIALLMLLETAVLVWYGVLREPQPPSPEAAYQETSRLRAEVPTFDRALLSEQRWRSLSVTQAPLETASGGRANPFAPAPKE